MVSWIVEKVRDFKGRFARGGWAVTIGNTRPSVLIFCADEMRADHLGCAGNAAIRTPNLDRLAARGAVFRGACCNNPICMPARATMFTGLLPRDHGLRVNGQSLRTDLPLLPQVLADAGYRTHAAGKLHLTAWVPMVEPPRPQQFPECLAWWRDGLIESFPVPYYAFQSVDFVGGHTSYACGDYMRWLKAQGGDAALLGPKAARGPAALAPDCYRMAMPEELHYNRYIADSAIRVLRETPAQEPFFIWCSFPDPHCPVAPPAPYCDWHRADDVPPPARRDGELDDLPDFYRKVMRGEMRPNGILNPHLTERQWREMIALTFGMVSHVDAEVGRVLRALEEAGRADDTIVIFTSDHGDMMGDHGLIWKAFYTFRGCVRIPLIIAAPDMPAGRISDAAACQLDLMPTVLDLCGVAMPGSDWAACRTPFERGSVRPLAAYPGRSLRPMLAGEGGSVRDAVVVENDDPCTGLRVRCLVTADHRITIYPGTGEGELFDLREDPWELYNLWYKPKHAGLRAQLTAALLDHYSLETPLHPIPPWNA